MLEQQWLGFKYIYIYIRYKLGENAVRLTLEQSFEANNPRGSPAPVPPFQSRASLPTPEDDSRETVKQDAKPESRVRETVRSGGDAFLSISHGINAAESMTKTTIRGGGGKKQEKVTTVLLNPFGTN